MVEKFMSLYAAAVVIGGGATPFDEKPAAAKVLESETEKTVHRSRPNES
jgi:hypothetical protein